MRLLSMSTNHANACIRGPAADTRATHLEDDAAKAVLKLRNHSLVICKILLEHGLLSVSDIIGDLLQLACGRHVLCVDLLDVGCQGFALHDIDGQSFSSSGLV